MTRSRSTAGRSWHFVTIRAPVLVPDGSCSLRPSNAALPANQGREDPPALPAHQERTRRRLLAGTSTARPTPLCRS